MQYGPFEISRTLYFLKHILVPTIHTSITLVTYFTSTKFIQTLILFFMTQGHMLHEKVGAIIDLLKLWPEANPSKFQLLFTSSPR